MTAKTIIVSGASKGIGLAVAQYLLSPPQSCNVVVIARAQEPLYKLKEQYPNQVGVIVGDVRDMSLGEKAVNLALSSFSRLDGLVLNHGIIGQHGSIANADLELWRCGFEINFFSLVALLKAALPSLRETKGRIILTSSGSAIDPKPDMGLYAATKAAMNTLTITLAREEPEVTSISFRPGMVDTEMQRELRENHQIPTFIAAYNHGKLLPPEKPGYIMARLVLNAPKSLSGRFISWNDKELEDFQ